MVKAEEAREKIYSLIDKGEFNESKKCLSDLDKELSEDIHFRVWRIGALAEICQGLDDEDTLVNCIRKNKPFKKHKHKKLNPYLLMELSNANMSLFVIRRRKAGNFPIRDNSLQNAKKNLREAIQTADRKDIPFLASLWVNYGNCLDTLGRGLEAMYVYDNALKLQPDHTMAIGNKAMALRHFANISGAHYIEMNQIAREMLLSAIGRNDITPFARRSFAKSVQTIEEIFSEHPELLERKPNHKPRNNKKDTIFERLYYDFCSTHKIFLNLHVHEDSCESSMLDDVSISLILAIEDQQTYPKLANFLNQIKQDYATARLILVQSQFTDKAISRISGRTVYTDTLEYCEFSLQNGLLENAYKGAYDILDKIAGFINEYLGIGLEKVQFDAGASIHWKSIWVCKDGKTREAIMNADNMSLYALYDIFQDFESGHFERFKEIRNSLTHRRLKVHIWTCNDDLDSTSQEELKAQAIELMKLVKSAIIYLINFIFIEEEKKRRSIKGPVPPIFLPHQINPA